MFGFQEFPSPLKDVKVIYNLFFSLNERIAVPAIHFSASVGLD